MNSCWSPFLYSWIIRLEMSEISCPRNFRTPSRHTWQSLFSKVESFKSSEILGLKLIPKLTPLQIFSQEYTKVHRVTISHTQKNLWIKNSRFFSPSAPHQVPARSSRFRVIKCVAQNCLTTILRRIVNFRFYF